ncbi:MAG: phosphatidylglycerol lysyltransferase domain-containing protein [Treponema sp.]|nr:phosphatidylglycerol lysyltransferase domain-containing protein [Treponema sp.]
MKIPTYPDFTPLTIDLKDEMYPHLNLTRDGVSEFTFAGLYLFRSRYNYRVSMGPDETFIISGEREGRKFFMTPCCVPPGEILQNLFNTHDYWKNISESVLAEKREILEQGIEFTEDRDNFDYLYLRSDLAELSGKRFHKKKNLVNAFNTAWPDHEGRQLTAELIPQAIEISDRWKAEKGEDFDYDSAREALENFETLRLRGAIYFVNGEPAAWCLGESIARGRYFVVHFEKARDEFKGIYQYMNQAFAASLPRFFTHINREQDLGDEGLRQAKMTYRPCGFVKKYVGVLKPCIAQSRVPMP